MNGNLDKLISIFLSFFLDGVNAHGFKCSNCLDRCLFWVLNSKWCVVWIFGSPVEEKKILWYNWYLHNYDHFVWYGQTGTLIHHLLRGFREKVTVWFGNSPPTLPIPFVTKLENNWVPLKYNQEYLSVRNHEDHYEPLLGSVPEKGTLSGRDWNLEKPRLELLVGMIWFYHTEFSHGDHRKKK